MLSFSTRPRKGETKPTGQHIEHIKIHVSDLIKCNGIKSNQHINVFGLMSNRINKPYVATKLLE